MKLILDTDPGVDDAMAYLYAHASPEIELVGVTTIFGNVTIEDATRNALWLNEFCGGAVRVYQGARAPLSIALNDPADFVHGPHGFGDVEIEPAKAEAEAMSAAEYLVNAAREMPGELTVCAVGPLTNIALAVQRDPDFVSNLKQLVIMGGALDVGGNVGDWAEANFWNDPHAAEIVLNAPGAGRVVVVGLDVTSRVEFLSADFDGLAAQSPKCGGFLREAGQFYMRFYSQKIGKMGCHMHDPAAMIACVRPDLFEMAETACQIVTEGEAIGDLRRREREDGRCVHVCVGVDGEAVREDYKRVLARLP